VSDQFDGGIGPGGEGLRIIGDFGRDPTHEDRTRHVRDSEEGESRGDETSFERMFKETKESATHIDLVSVQCLADRGDVVGRGERLHPALSERRLLRRADRADGVLDERERLLATRCRVNELVEATEDLCVTEPRILDGSGGDESLSIAEMVVDRTSGHARDVDDTVDVESGETLGLELVYCDGDDLLDGLLTVAAPTSRLPHAP